MGKKVGIPRSLFYYKFIAFWEVFFAELGLEIVVSDPTSKRILDDGVRTCVDEACLPVKLFFGHVINLKDRVDYILIPRFTSISRKEYICPEFGGLPDIVRHRVKGLPGLIDAEVNLRDSDRGGMKAAVEAGRILGSGRRASIAAYKKAMGSLGRSADSLKGNGSVKGDSSARFMYEFADMFSYDGKAAGVSPGENRPREHVREYPRMAVIGHPYTVYDRYISMDLLGKLKKYGVDVVTIEMVDDGDINRQAARLEKPMFWHYGRTAYGTAMHLAESGDIDGIICISSFGCGIDSFVNDLIERRIRKEYKIPMIVLTIDEHTGEAGFNTRLEAFVDMLKWRRLHEDYISTSG